MRRCRALVFLLAGAAGAARSQETVPAVETELVRLDVVVTDEEGRLVRSLGRDDFELREDGKAQTLTQFLMAEPGPSPSADAAGGAKAPAGGAPTPAAAGPGRHIVVVIDDLHIASTNFDLTRQALGRFLDGLVREGDRVALVATSGAAVRPFTADRAEIQEAVGTLTPRAAAFPHVNAGDLTPAQAELVLRGDISTLKLVARTLIDTPGTGLALEGPRAVEFARRNPPPAGLDADEAFAADEAKRRARGVLAEALRFSVATLDTIDAALRGLSALPGRKLCLLISDGFLVGAGTTEERTRDLRQVVDAATRSGAVVYALDARGLVTSLADAGVAGSAGPPGLGHAAEREAEQLVRATLETVSKDTGGFLVRATNDLADGLGRMLADNDAYYLMAYEPLNAKHDGKFRRIEVRVPAHPDFTIRTRSGYYAPVEGKKTAEAAAPRAVLSLLPAFDEAEARAVLAAPLGRSLPVRLTADYVDLPPTGPQAIVRGHVDLGPLRGPGGGVRRATIELMGGVYDTTGRPVGKLFGRRADLALSGADARRALQEGLRYQTQLPLAPGRYEVRLVAREKALGRVGGAAQWVEVPDLGQKTLAMSSVFLTSSAESPQAAGDAEALREVHTLRQFRESDSLYFQFYVYNASRDEAGASDVVLQAQIWSGQEVIAASRPTPAELRAGDGGPLPETQQTSLAGLAPGPYLLKIVVVDRKANAMASRQVDFTVQ